MTQLVYLAFGVAFGFMLSRSRASDYDAIIGMFRFTDLHLMGVMAGAIGTAALGLWWLRSRRRKALIGCDIEVKTKPMHRGVLPASLVFGTGWALTGG